MDTYPARANHAADFLRAQGAPSPKVLLLAGTGLGASLDGLEIHTEIPYGGIPHFPVSTVAGHSGKLLLGVLKGVPVAALSGRFHLYEGYSAQEVTFPLRVLTLLGCRFFFFSSAVGGIGKHLAAGDAALVADHVNLTGHNPLTGPNVDAWGPRFPDMSQAYDPGLMEFADAAAREAGFHLPRAVYGGLVGPSLETPAELKFLRTIGCDVVGLSSVMEVIAARHAGLRVLGLAVVTNTADPDRPAPASLEEILAVAGKAAPRAGAVFSGVLAALARAGQV
jgi:purine-nucleoside phosphorylase